MDTKTQKRKRLKQLCSDYDAAVKRILTKKYVLAHIPKGCTEEFSDCSIEEIVEKHLTFAPIYGETTVDEDETNAELAAKVTSSEHATTSEGKVVFDTRFKVLAPNTKRPLVSSSISKGNANRNCAIHAVLPSRRACRCIANSRRRIWLSKSVF
ncbi:MAG: hypothetical protein KIG72_03580 [Bradymonadales bacterium]|nr:hypothetical protein [Bradymonadales bacterium]